MSRIPRLIVAFIAAGAAAYLSYNELCLLLDPYNVVWNRREMQRGASVLEQFRFHKTEHLQRAPDVYDAIILGNSRGFDSRTAQLSRTLGRRIYNYSVSSDYPLGYLMKVLWLERTQTKLRDVVLLLWYDQFQMAGTNDAVLLAREHPALTGEDWISYYWSFSELPSETVKNLIWHYVRAIIGLSHDDAKIINNGIDPETGDYVLVEASRDRDEAARRAYQTRVAASKPGLHFRSHSMTPEEQEQRARAFAEQPLQDIQRKAFVEMMNYLRASKLQFHCVVPPMNATAVSWVPRDRYVEWVRFVLEECDEVWDFSLPNTITVDGFNYLDWSHFTSYVGYLMLAKVLDGKAPKLKEHADFGRLLLRSDSDRYSAMLEAAMRK
jgi:hypothetical protein